MPSHPAAVTEFRELLPTPLSLASASARARAVGAGILSEARAFRLLEWLPEYSREKLFKDIVAACVITTLLVPQSMSYARVAGCPIQYGLYSSVVPLFAYGLFTTSMTQQFGVVAPSSILANSIVRGLLGPGAAEGTEAFAVANVKLAFACGVVMSLMTVLRLGWVAAFVSFPVIVGFTWGSAFLIIASQVSDLFGIPVPRLNAFGDRMNAAIVHLPSANGISAAIGVCSLFFLLYAKDVRIRGRQLHKLTPTALIVLIIGIVVSFVGGLSANGVKTVGTIPNKLPPPVLPFSGADSAAEFVSYLGPAVLQSIVGYVQTLSVANIFAKRRNEHVSASRELTASAAASLCGSFFSSISLGGSFTRTAVAYDAGVATPLAGMLVGVLMIVAILVLTGVLSYLPNASLAAVVVASTKSLLDPTDPRLLWARKPWEFLVFLVTFVGMLLFDVQYGLFAGIGASLLLVLIRAFTPRLVELARLPGTDTYVYASRFPAAQRVLGVLVLRLDGEISFGNVQRVVSRLALELKRALAARASANLTGSAALDAGGSEGVAAEGDTTEGSVESSSTGVREGGDTAAGGSLRNRRFRTVYAIRHEDNLAEEDDAAIALLAPPLTPPSPRGPSGIERPLVVSVEDAHFEAPPAQRGAGSVVGESAGVCSLATAPSMPPATAPSSPASIARPVAGSGAAAVVAHAGQVPLRGIVLDCSRVVDMDATACRELKEIADAYARAHLPLIFAALPGPVRDTMEQFELDGQETVDRKAAAARAAAAAARTATDAGTGGTAADEAGGAAATPVMAAPQDAVPALCLLSTRFMSVAAAVRALRLDDDAHEQGAAG